MKYIRTKKFITELESYMTIENNILIIGGAEHKIVKQADTIEELCDEFVFITSKRKFINKMDFRKIELLFGKEEQLLEMFGAIWTDKGLIYVAKMNEKGELELL